MARLKEEGEAQIRITSLYGARAIGQCSSALAEGSKMQRPAFFACQVIKSMNHFLLISSLWTILAVFPGCNKQKNDMSSQIIGRWELREVQNGMIPAVTYPAGNGIVLVFTGAGYERYENGQLVKSGHYAIVKDNAALPGECLDLSAGQSVIRLLFDGNRNDSKRIEELTSNKLVLTSGCAALDSGGYMEYEREGR